MGPFRMNPEGPLNAADMFGEVMFTLQCLGFNAFIYIILSEFDIWHMYHLYQFHQIWMNSIPQLFVP